MRERRPRRSVVAALGLLLCLIGWSQVSPAVTFVAASGRTALGSSSASHANVLLKRDTRLVPHDAIELVEVGSAPESAVLAALADPSAPPFRYLEFHRSPLGSRPPPFTPSL